LQSLPYHSKPQSFTSHLSRYIQGYLDVSRGLLLWQRSESKIWLDDAELGEQGLGLVILDAGVDDNIISRDPVDWGGDTVLVASLEGVDDTENFGGVAASGGWVREDEADGLLWVNDENRADGERNALGIDIGSILVVKPRRGQFSHPASRSRAHSHVVGKGDLAVLVPDDWERQLAARDLINILDPSSV
jgi:hypothetical protein